MKQRARLLVVVLGLVSARCKIARGCSTLLRPKRRSVGDSLRRRERLRTKAPREKYAMYQPIKSASPLSGVPKYVVCGMICADCETHLAKTSKGWGNEAVTWRTFESSLKLPTNPP